MCVLIITTFQTKLVKFSRHLFIVWSRNQILSDSLPNGLFPRVSRRLGRELFTLPSQMVDYTAISLVHLIKYARKPSFHVMVAVLRRVSHPHLSSILYLICLPTVYSEGLDCCKSGLFNRIVSPPTTSRLQPSGECPIPIYLTCLPTVYSEGLDCY
jgi:hypothetical protein